MNLELHTQPQVDYCRTETERPLVQQFAQKVVQHIPSNDFALRFFADLGSKGGPGRTHEGRTNQAEM